MKNAIAVAITFGVLSSSVKEQLKAQGLTADRADLNVWDKAAKAISMLHVTGFLSDAEVHRARNRMMKDIAKRARQVVGPSRTSR